MWIDYHLGQLDLSRVLFGMFVCCSTRFVETNVEGKTQVKLVANIAKLPKAMMINMPGVKVEYGENK